MAQEQSTIGDVSARLIKLMATRGGKNELMFAAGTVEQLQCGGITQLLRDCNDLREAIGLKQVPHYTTLQ